MNPLPVPEPTEQVAPAPEPAAPDPAEPPEVVVWGRLAVDQAHDRLVRRIEELGYRVVRREDDTVVLRGSGGRVFVYEDGSLAFTHPVAGMVPSDPTLASNDPQRDRLDNLRTAGMESQRGATGYVLPSASRKQGSELRVFEATTEERRDLGSLFERTAQEEALESLADRLDRLWTLGEPLSLGAPPVPESDRRGVVLAWWAARPDDPYGARATVIVERWMAATFPTPITPAERARHEADRADGRALPAVAGP